MDYAKSISKKNTPQSQPLAGEKQVKNNAGGYVYEVDKWTQLQRFCIIGTEGGTYYVKEQPLTIENAQNVIACIKEDGVRVVNLCKDISVNGKAAKQNSTIFVLALCVVHGDLATRSAVYSNLSLLFRTTTQLFTFVDYLKTLGKSSGMGLRKALAAWYTEKSRDSLIYQVTKYQTRNSWAHRDLLRLAHPRAVNEEQNEIFKYLISDTVTENTPERIRDINNLAKLSEKELIAMIQKHNLTWEMLPTTALNSKAVWSALLQNMPITATIRNLAKMTSIGLLDMGSQEVLLIEQRLSSEAAIHAARVHPINVLIGMYTYKEGKGFRGNLNWNPNARIVAALERAFYLSFKNVEPTNKRYLLGLDVSGSMSTKIFGSPLSSAEAVGAIAMNLMRTESDVNVFGFCNNFVDLGITSVDSLSGVMKKVQRMNFGSTNCALPMTHALKHNIPVDTFVVMTDNETWVGTKHASEALRKYRKKTGIPAKLAVLATTASKFSIADPTDSGMLDLVGFSADVPSVLAKFSLGEI